MKQEVRLLLNLQIINLIRLDVDITPNVIADYNRHLSTSRSDYTKLATERRLVQIASYVDSSKGLKRRREDSSKLDGFEGLEAEPVKSAESERIQEQKVSIENMNNDLLPVQLFTECPWPRKEVVINDEWSFPESEQDILLYSIYQDLWKRGHYITCGLKFGCDYTVYEFDPLVAHAKYMVKCQSQTSDLTGLQILILSRISTQVKKELLIASLDNNQEAIGKESMSIRGENYEHNYKPIYLSINWRKN